MLFVPGSVFLLFPYRIAAMRGPHMPLGVFKYFAWFPWLLGTALLLPSFWNFVYRGRGTPHPADPPKALVVSGPYRFTRNPQYLGGLLLLTGHFLWTGALWLLPYFSIIALAFQTFVTLYEEPHLEERFGEDYHHYRMHTPRWLNLRSLMS